VQRGQEQTATGATRVCKVQCHNYSATEGTAVWGWARRASGRSVLVQHQAQPMPASNSHARRSSRARRRRASPGAVPPDVKTSRNLTTSFLLGFTPVSPLLSLPSLPWGFCSFLLVTDVPREAGEWGRTLGCRRLQHPCSIAASPAFPQLPTPQQLLMAVGPGDRGDARGEALALLPAGSAQHGPAHMLGHGLRAGTSSGCQHGESSFLLSFLFAMAVPALGPSTACGRGFKETSAGTPFPSW